MRNSYICYRSKKNTAVSSGPLNNSYKFRFLQHAFKLWNYKRWMVTLYFKVSLLQCSYTFKYRVIIINYTYLLGVGVSSKSKIRKSLGIIWLFETRTPSLYACTHLMLLGYSYTERAFTLVICIITNDLMYLKIGYLNSSHNCNMLKHINIVNVTEWQHLLT